MKKSIKKLLSYLLLLFGCILYLMGCRKEDTSAEPKEQSTPLVDWKQEGFTVFGEVEEEQGFWVQEFIPWGHEEVVVDPESEALLDRLYTVEPRSLDGKIYRLGAVSRPSYIEAIRWILEIYNTETMQVTVREFTPEQLGQEEVDRDCFLVAMDLADEENFVFQWIESGRNEEGLVHQTANKIIYWNLQNDTAVTDLWNICLEEGILEEEFAEYTWIPLGNCVCDGAGNTYIMAGDTGYGDSRLASFDREGNLLLDYRCSQEQTLEEPLRTESGELIYPVYNMRKKYYDFMWADIQTGEMKLLASFDSSRRIKRMYGMQGNDVYYEMSEGIVRWDISTGKRTLVFRYQENGIGTGYETMLAFREGQPPVLRLYRTLHGQQPEDWLAPLSREIVTHEEAVRVVDLTGGDQGSRQVSECAALVSRRDLNKGFTYESATQNPEDFRTRIVAELTAGKGPDILFVSRSDMEILYKTGLLLDLREVIPEETLGDLLPGVIGLGTLDGELVGMAGGVYAQGLAVSTTVWGKDTWRLEDFTALVEEGKLEGGIYYSNSGRYFASFATMRGFTEHSLQNSFLIDWENRECHFEDERYLRFLEAVNIDTDSLEADSETELKGGKRVAFIDLSRDGQLNDFGSFIAREGGNFVGHPTEGNSGNYLMASGVVAVNANTDKKEAVRTFLEYFLGEEIQSLNGDLINSRLGVRKISPEELEQDEEGRYFWRGEEVTVFEDGTTSLHKAKEFLESCVPEPIVDPVLSRILYEELEALWMDKSKDPAKTAEVIDRRIQTYLDENN